MGFHAIDPHDAPDHGRADVSADARRARQGDAGIGAVVVPRATDSAFRKKLRERNSMRTRACSSIVAAATLLSAAADAQQDYPNRTVTIVNPTQAGATTDVLARALVVGLSSRLGQQFVVVNRTGASGAIGTASVARAAPDGYTLLFGAVYVLSVLPAARSADIGYEAQALVPVCQIGSPTSVAV